MQATRRRWPVRAATSAHHKRAVLVAGLKPQRVDAAHTYVPAVAAICFVGAQPRAARTHTCTTRGAASQCGSAEQSAAAAVARDARARADQYVTAWPARRVARGKQQRPR